MTNDNINQVNKSAVALDVDDARQRVAAANATADLDTPASNTGGLVSEAYLTMVMVNGKPKELLLKKGSSTAAFIDTLTIPAAFGRL